MNANTFCRIGVLALLTTMAAAVPALADTQFRVRRMMRNDVPPGKGQCDIRLQVDQEAEVSVRGETVSIRTIAGRDPRDDGSECNAPLPPGDVAGFNFEVMDRRGEIRLLSEPSRRSGGAAVVLIRDSAGGEGRYHFRLSWAIGGAMPPPVMPEPRREPGFPERRGGFVWDDEIRFRGEGRGTVTFDRAPQRIFGVNVDIDRRGRIVVSFRMEGGRTLQFTGTVVDREGGGRLHADVVSDDRFRARGMMVLSVDNRREVNSVTLDAENGRDRMRVVWDRR
jgi:hypothetical protein